MANREISNVILQVESTPDLMQAAQAALLRQDVVPPVVASTLLPDGFVIDRTFAPIPITRTAAQRAVMGPQEQTPSESLIVRGQIARKDVERASGRSRNRLFSDPFVEAMATTCAATPPVGTAADVERLLDCARLKSVGMHGGGVAIAILDGGINLPHLRAAPRSLLPNFNAPYSWSASPSITPGSAVVGHGTMCAYDALIAAPNAILLDYAALTRGVTPGGPAFAALLSDVVRAFSQLLSMMIVPPGPGARFFDSLVVSNSWGVFDPGWDFPPGHGGRYTDNPTHPFNIVTAALASSGADIMFAAGNCGPVCPDGRCGAWPAGAPIITGANSHPEVLCVAGVDTGNAVVGYSSHGPGALHHDKPDVAAYTHFLGSEALGAGQPDSGTSAACPVLAGVVAALRSIYPYHPGKPNRSVASVAKWLRQHCARHPTGTAGWTADVGFGIIETHNLGPGIAALN